jgi:hypothetical protein
MINLINKKIKISYLNYLIYKNLISGRFYRVSGFILYDLTRFALRSLHEILLLSLFEVFVVVFVLLDVLI